MDGEFSNAVVDIPTGELYESVASRKARRYRRQMK